MIIYFNFNIYFYNENKYYNKKIILQIKLYFIF